jgi:hypothetical protein
LAAFYGGVHTIARMIELGRPANSEQATLQIGSRSTGETGSLVDAQHLLLLRPALWQPGCHRVGTMAEEGKQPFVTPCALLVLQNP